MAEIKSGDIIFVSTRGIISDIIRKVTSGKFTHVGIVSGSIKSHTLICEAGLNGIDQNDLIWRHKYKESYSIYRLNDITEHQRDELVSQCLLYVGLPYDYSALINFFVKASPFGTDKQLYCSEMIYRALIGLGLVEPKYNPEEISPTDLYWLLEPKMTLVHKEKF